METIIKMCLMTADEHKTAGSYTETFALLTY